MVVQRAEFTQYPCTTYTTDACPIAIQSNPLICLATRIGDSRWRAEASSLALGSWSPETVQCLVVAAVKSAAIDRV